MVVLHAENNGILQVTDNFLTGLSAQYFAIMAVWSKALLLTASCLSKLPRFESRPGRV